MNNSINIAQIELALNDLNRQLIPKYCETARRYNVVKSTLRRRHQGITISREAAKSEHWQKLNNPQEEVLIEHVNNLTD